MLLTGRRRESLDAAARGVTDASARSRATSPTPSNLPMVRFDKTVGAYFGKTGKRRWRAFELTVQLIKHSSPRSCFFVVPESGNLLAGSARLEG